MEKVIVYSKPVSPVTEAYRALCLNLLASLGDKKVIEVTGVTTNSNSGEVVANLAVAAAQTGKNILVMDCNFRKPMQHEVYGLQNNGIAEVLRSNVDFHDFVQATVQPNLQLLAAGTAEAEPAAILQSAELQQTIETARNEYDLVLLDVPAAGETTDAVLLGTKTDGTILVVANKTDKAENVQKVKEMLTQAGITIIGSILNKAEEVLLNL